VACSYQFLGSPVGGLGSPVGGGAPVAVPGGVVGLFGGGELITCGFGV
jgi:hypothetical protein